MYVALKNLLEEPQNNLKIFKVNINFCDYFSPGPLLMYPNELYFVVHFSLLSIDFIHGSPILCHF